MADEDRIDPGIAYIRYPYLRSWRQPHWNKNYWFWDFCDVTIRLFQDGSMDESYMGIGPYAESHQFYTRDLP